MFFRRKPKPPLARADTLVREAVAVVYSYWRDTNYQPSEADLRLLRRLENMLCRSHAAVRRIAIRMERRFHGEPEINEHKWSRRYSHNRYPLSWQPSCPHLLRASTFLNHGG